MTVRSGKSPHSDTPPRWTVAKKALDHLLVLFEVKLQEGDCSDEELSALVKLAVSTAVDAAIQSPKPWEGTPPLREAIARINGDTAVTLLFLLHSSRKGKDNFKCLDGTVQALIGKLTKGWMQTSDLFLETRFGKEILAQELLYHRYLKEKEAFEKGVRAGLEALTGHDKYLEKVARFTALDPPGSLRYSRSMLIVAQASIRDVAVSQLQRLFASYSS